VSAKNASLTSSICNLTLYVEYQYQRSDGSVLTGRTGIETVARLASLQETEFHALGGGGAYPFELLDYTPKFNWTWC
jgi:hypothetical protein